MSRCLTLQLPTRRTSLVALAAIGFTSLVGCTSTHTSTIVLDASRDAHVLVTGSNPAVELHADPATSVEVTWQRPSMPDEKQQLGGYVARTIRGGGALLLTSSQRTTVRVKCKGATGFGVTQPASITASAPVRQ